MNVLIKTKHKEIFNNYEILKFGNVHINTLDNKILEVVDQKDNVVAEFNWNEVVYWHKTDKGETT